MTSSAPRLALSVAGRGPLVVFVHAMGGGRTMWHAQVQALADRFTTVSVDLRGYGDSEPPDGPLDFRRDFSADLLAVIEYFNVGTAHLVGLSMGSRVAGWTTLLHPERVASLTLVSASPGFDLLSPAEVEQYIAVRTFAPEGDAVPIGYGMRQARAVMAPCTPEPVLRRAALLLDGVSATHYLRVLRALIEQDRGFRPEDIACPVHLIAGDLDPIHPAEASVRMRDRLREPHLTNVAQAGHFSNLEQPEAFNRALRKFLLRQPSQLSASHIGH